MYAVVECWLALFARIINNAFQFLLECYMHTSCTNRIMQIWRSSFLHQSMLSTTVFCNLIAVHCNLFKKPANAAMPDHPDPIDHRLRDPDCKDGTLTNFAAVSEKVAALSSSVAQPPEDTEDAAWASSPIEEYLVNETRPIHRKRTRKCRRAPSANRSRQNCQECQASSVEEIMVCAICEYVAIYGRKPYALLLHPLIKESGEEVAEILGVPRAQLEQKLPRAGSEYLLTGRKGKNNKYPVGLKESASTTRSSSPENTSQLQKGYGRDPRYAPIFKEMQLARHGVSSMKDVRKAVDAVASALIMDRLDEDPIKRVLQMARVEALLKPRRP
jgi:hypothetical protein